MIQNSFIGKDFLPDHIKSIANAVESYFVVENSGLYVVFENVSILWPSSKIVEPFTVARHDFEREGPEPEMPPEVVSRLEQEGWKYLIWFPYEVAHGEINQFVLRYAHELQHYKQYFNRESLGLANEYLLEAKRSGRSPSCRAEQSKHEFDAEMASLEIYEKLFSAYEFQNFIISIPEQKMRNYYSRLIELRREFKQWCSENIV